MAHVRTLQRPAAVEEPTPFVAALEAANLHPLWDRFRKITPVKPQASDPPMHWRWSDIEPFANRAVGEVAIDDVERRALILVNPAFGGETVTTRTCAEGAATIVNGRRCAMRAGDLILTPPMCWHGHINESDHRIVWFDAANIPLIRGLDANFFEPGEPEAGDFWQVDEGEERLWSEAGLIGADLSPAHAHSPKYHYSGAATRRMLAAVPAGPDGARSLRYVNPATGGAVMPALDCHAVRLTDGAATRAKRTTCNMVCLVVSGAGRSTVGDHAFEWSQHDVFTVPHWTWASHAARDGDADLFVVSDRCAFERLDLLREEMR